MNRKHITAGLVTAATILGANTVTAGADTTGTCVRFDTRFVRTATAETETRPLDLAAGSWVMTIHTFDSYPERPASPVEEQDSERVTVLGVTTDDLPDGVETGEVTTTATVTLDQAITELTATHAHDGHGWQSVGLDTVCFAPVVEHPAVEVPEVAPPVETPVVVVAEAPAPPVAELPVIKAPHFNG